MTTKELIEDLQKEYIQSKERGEFHPKIMDFEVFFRINKYFSSQEKKKFCLKAILDTLEYFNKQRISIIISKAFLLAEDDKIEDKVILNQINKK